MKREIGKYIPPGFKKEAFHCPYCNIAAHQYWHTVLRDDGRTIDGLYVAICNQCRSYSCWIGQAIVYPPCGTAPPAAENMPQSVLKLYEEARSIAPFSSRATAALLRLTAEKLCKELGETSKNLNQAIKNLKKRGLPEAVIQSLDTVRIVGNEGGAHEGQIDLNDKDNEEVVGRLFRLINIIVEKTITEPKYIAETFGSLPEDKRKAVADRDDS